MLSLLHHQNLVKLIGYCADGDQRLLVYEYMTMGSLEDHLVGTVTRTAWFMSFYHARHPATLFFVAFAYCMISLMQIVR